MKDYCQGFEHTSYTSLRRPFVASQTYTVLARYFLEKTTQMRLAAFNTRLLHEAAQSILIIINILSMTTSVFEFFYIKNFIHDNLRITSPLIEFYLPSLSGSIEAFEVKSDRSVASRDSTANFRQFLNIFSTTSGQNGRSRPTRNNSQLTISPGE